MVTERDDWKPGRSLLPDRLPREQDLRYGLGDDDQRREFEKGNADAAENELPPHTKGGPNDD